VRESEVAGGWAPSCLRRKAAQQEAAARVGEVRLLWEPAII
jgi:hypothetical protein